MGFTNLFLLVYGVRLVETTWHQTIAELPSIGVGISYLPIPIGGFFTLLYIIEHLTIGRPASAGTDPHLPVE
jgi:TRAP-type C4-dicarboxylate transport system permease small subunit